MNTLCVMFFWCLVSAKVNFGFAQDDDDLEGSKCRFQQLSGHCRKVFDCPIAVSQLKQGFPHNLKRCGWDGRVEILCCPEALERGPSLETSTTYDSSEIWTVDNYPKITSSNTIDGNDPDQEARFTKRKCEQACDEYSRGIQIEIQFHIFGGKPALTGEFPHMAALGFENDDGDGIDWKRCGASLISHKFLLTAAHCIINTQRPVIKKALLGAVDLSSNDKSTWQEFEVVNYTVYPKYDSRGKWHDLAIVELKGSIKITNSVRPACLYTKNDDPLKLVVTGWGKTTMDLRDDRSTTLQKAELEAVPVPQCNASYISRGRRIIFNQICTLANTSDACMGDSGGPLQIQTPKFSYSIVGVVSYGVGCGGSIPGVFTRVSQYLDWIESIVWPE